MKWEPTNEDVKWMESRLSLLKDGGVWACPCSGTLFTFYHHNKTYTITRVLVADSLGVNNKTHKILKMLGWTLTPTK